MALVTKKRKAQINISTKHQLPISIQVSLFYFIPKSIEINLDDPNHVLNPPSGIGHYAPNLGRSGQNF